jgi:hypothetical protein
METVVVLIAAFTVVLISSVVCYTVQEVKKNKHKADIIYKFGYPPKHCNTLGDPLEEE